MFADVFRRKIEDRGKKVYDINEGVSDPWNSRRVAISCESSLDTRGIQEGLRSECSKRGTQVTFNYTDT